MTRAAIERAEYRRMDHMKNAAKAQLRSSSNLSRSPGATPPPCLSRRRDAGAGVLSCVTATATYGECTPAKLTSPSPFNSLPKGCAEREKFGLWGGIGLFQCLVNGKRWSSWQYTTGRVEIFTAGSASSERDRRGRFYSNLIFVGGALIGLNSRFLSEKPISESRLGPVW